MKSILSITYLLIAYFIFPCIINTNEPNISNHTNSGRLSANPIHEEEFLTIGGIEQWVTIDGDDRNNPVMLFIHGGPGSPLSPYADAIFGEWEKDYVLVQWDQRGAGRTYGQNAPAELSKDYLLTHPLTLEKMTSDGLALSAYLTKHLNKEKVILFGTSWGSVLGTSMAIAEPKLFHAYIGVAQIVTPSKNILTSYHKVLNLATKSNDQTSIDKLKSLGVPPYPNARNFGQLFRIIKKYEADNSEAAPSSWGQIATTYDNDKDNKNRYEGDDYSFFNYIGHEQLEFEGMYGKIDFMKSGMKMDVPVYLIQGEHDLLTYKESTREYFDNLLAPKKEYVLVKSAAHGFNQDMINSIFTILNEKILPTIAD